MIYDVNEFSVNVNELLFSFLVCKLHLSDRNIKLKNEGKKKHFQEENSRNDDKQQKRTRKKDPKATT